MTLVQELHYQIQTLTNVLIEKGVITKEDIDKENERSKREYFGKNYKEGR